MTPRTVFDALKTWISKKLAQNRLAGLTSLDETNIKPALRKFAFHCSKPTSNWASSSSFWPMSKAPHSALRFKRGSNTKVPYTSVSAADQFVKLCHDSLVDMMKSDREAIVFAQADQRTRIMMVGLQGAGKTTTCAKLARKLKNEGKKPLLVACDMQRPAAVEQLQTLGAQIDVPVFNISPAKRRSTSPKPPTLPPKSKAVTSSFTTPLVGWP